MQREYFIGLDVHGQETEIAVVTATGRLSKRMRVATTIPALTEAIGSVRRPRWAVMEEEPLAGWLFRHLAAQVDGMMVCDPRRNALIAKDSDKDDPIDAEKLAPLRRGGFVKPVHHPDTWERAWFNRGPTWPRTLSWRKGASSAGCWTPMGPPAPSKGRRTSYP